MEKIKTEGEIRGIVDQELWVNSKNTFIKRSRCYIIIITEYN